MAVGLESKKKANGFDSDDSSDHEDLGFDPKQPSCAHCCRNYAAGGENPKVTLPCGEDFCTNCVVHLFKMAVDCQPFRPVQCPSLSCTQYRNNRHHEILATGPVSEALGPELTSQYLLAKAASA